MLVPFIIAVELAGARTRTLVGINIEVPFAIGEAVVSLIGIRVKDWKDFQVMRMLDDVCFLIFVIDIKVYPKILDLS